MHIHSHRPTLPVLHANRMHYTSLAGLRNRYRIAYSINGNPLVMCPIITANHPLGLAEDGQCHCDEADIILSVSPNNELVIEETSHAEIIITRSGRQYHLKPNKPICVFKNDMITIGHSNIEIVHECLIHCSFIPKSSCIRSPSTSYSTTSSYLRILSTIAAVFTLCAVPAAVYAQTPDNNAAPEVIQPSENSSIPEMIYKRFKAIAPQSVHPSNNDTSKPNTDTKSSHSTQCKEGKQLCLSNNRYKCVKHRWELVETCMKPAHCIGGNGRDTECQDSEPCQVGRYACYDNEIYKCEYSHWILDRKCKIPLSCILKSETEAECAEVDQPMEKTATEKNCTDDQMKCESNAVMECRNGLWQYEEICAPIYQECKRISDVEAKCVRTGVKGGPQFPAPFHSNSVFEHF